MKCSSGFYAAEILNKGAKANSTARIASTETKRRNFSMESSHVYISIFNSAPI